MNHVKHWTLHTDAILQSLTENRKLQIGDQSLNINVVRSKLFEDIRFLEKKIEQIKKNKSPNSIMLKNYEQMLKTRLAVVEWLQPEGLVYDAPQQTQEDGVSTHRQETHLSHC